MLINIQLLRFLAATLVVLYHTAAHVRDAGIEPGWLFIVSEAVGFAGVDIFFVISGFIMVWTTRHEAGMAESWSFLRRRLARIYSGYWPFFLLALGLFAWINPVYVEQTDLVKSFFLWPTYPLLIAISWTLIFELFFYLCFTLLLAFTDRRRLLWLWLAITGIIFWAVYSQFGREAFAVGNLEQMSLAEYYTLSPYLAEFLAGALLACGLGREYRKPSASGVMAWLLLLLGVAGFLTGGWINNALFGTHIEQGYYLFWRVLTFGAPSILIVAGLVRLEQSGILAPRSFSLITGGASYAIYLSHILLLALAQHLGFNRWAGSFAPWMAKGLFLLLVAVIIGLSVLHYRKLERPLHRLFKRMAGVG